MEKYPREVTKLRVRGDNSGRTADIKVLVSDRKQYRGQRVEEEEDKTGKPNVRRNNT